MAIANDAGYQLGGLHTSKLRLDGIDLRVQGDDLVLGRHVAFDISDVVFGGHVLDDVREHVAEFVERGLLRHILSVYHVRGTRNGKVEVIEVASAFGAALPFGEPGRVRVLVCR